MKILAIDTSSKNCSTSISEINKNEFNILSIKESNDERTHSQKLMPMIDECFKISNLHLNNINLLSCCVGPGSFTGIRIGVSTIKAFSDVTNIPVVGVTSLESLSYNILENGIIIPIIDAKNNNVYSALFSNSDNNYSSQLNNITDNINIVLERFASYLTTNKIEKNIYFVGNGSILYNDLIKKYFADFPFYFSNKNEQSSISLAKCAYNKYNSGIYGDSNSLVPIYLRKSQAERSLKNNE